MDFAFFFALVGTNLLTFGITALALRRIAMERPVVQNLQQQLRELKVEHGRDMVHIFTTIQSGRAKKAGEFARNRAAALALAPTDF